jgi:hypothetical protein
LNGFSIAAIKLEQNRVQYFELGDQIPNSFWGFLNFLDEVLEFEDTVPDLDTKGCNASNVSNETKYFSHHRGSSRALVYAAQKPEKNGDEECERLLSEKQAAIMKPRSPPNSKHSPWAVQPS